MWCVCQEREQALQMLGSKPSSVGPRGQTTWNRGFWWSIPEPVVTLQSSGYGSAEAGLVQTQRVCKMIVWVLCCKKDSWWWADLQLLISVNRKDVNIKLPPEEPGKYFSVSQSKLPLAQGRDLSWQIAWWVGQCSSVLSQFTLLVHPPCCSWANGWLWKNSFIDE